MSGAKHTTRQKSVTELKCSGLVRACKRKNNTTVRDILSNLSSDCSRRKILLYKQACSRDLDDADSFPVSFDSPTPMKVALENLNINTSYLSTLAVILETVKDPSIRASLLEIRDESNEPSMILEQVMNAQLEKLPPKRKTKLDNFRLFDTSVSAAAESYNDMKSKHFLYILSNANSLDLIHHEYVQRYIRCHWDTTCIKWMVWASLLLYLTMLASTTSIIAMICRHGNQTINNNPLNASSVDGLKSSNYFTSPTMTDINIAHVFQGAFSLAPACILLLLEAVQMYAKGWSYWSYVYNYFDLLTPCGAFTVCILAMFQNCESLNLIIFDVALLTVMWMHGTWKVATIPQIPAVNFDEFAMRWFCMCCEGSSTELPPTPSSMAATDYTNDSFSGNPSCCFTCTTSIRKYTYKLHLLILNIVKSTSMTFMMFTEVLFSGFASLSIIFYYCLFFAIVFKVILGRHVDTSEFYNIGHGIMTVLAMAMGEIDYKEVYHDSSHPLSSKEYIAGYLVLIFFLMCLPIAGFNLLISRAIEDVRNVKETSEHRIFRYQIGAIIEFNRIRQCFSPQIKMDTEKPRTESAPMRTLRSMSRSISTNMATPNMSDEDSIIEGMTIELENGGVLQDGTLV